MKYSKCVKSSVNIPLIPIYISLTLLSVLLDLGVCVCVWEEDEKVWFDALTYGLSARSSGGGGKQDGDNLSGKSNTKSQRIQLISCWSRGDFHPHRGRVHGEEIKPC